MKVIAWFNLIGNIVIIGTGGTVRLTGSGLGCTSWPFCTTGTADWHAIVEFSNRGVGGLLGILAILAVIAVWRYRPSARTAASGTARKDLWVLAWILLIGVVVEGLLGAVTVFVDLNVWSVGIHFVLSAVLVGIATSFVIRASRAAGPRALAIPKWLYGITHLTTALLALVIVGGVLTAAHGPYSGDANVVRNESAWDVFVHIHAYLGYALALAIVVLVVGGFVARAWRFGWSALAVVVWVGVEIAIGLTQARIGLPPLLVGTHMVLAAIGVALLVWLVDSAKRPAVAAPSA